MQETTQTQNQTLQAEAVCPLCGGDHFVWGEATATMFRPDGEGASVVRPVRARMCAHCRNLQLFVEALQADS